MNPINRIAVLFLLAFTSACSNSSENMKVSYSPWPGYEILNSAIEEGYISNLEIVRYEDQADPARAFSRGLIDIAQLTGIEISNICKITPDRCPVIILVIDQSTGGDQLMSINFSDVNDLKGRKVAVTTDAFGTYVLYQSLQDSHLSVDDIALRPMVMDKMPEALANGEVDAIVTYPPTSELARELGASTIFDSSSVPAAVLDYMVVSPNLYLNEESKLRALVAGWLKFLQKFEKDEKPFIESMAMNEGLEPNEFKELLEGLKFYSNPASQVSLLSQDGLAERNIDLIYQAGIQLGTIDSQTLKPRISSKFLRSSG